MAPNHSEQPDPDHPSTDPGDLTASAADPVEAGDGPSGDGLGGEVPADTGSISLSLLIAPAQEASPEPEAPAEVAPMVLADEDLPPLRTSELAIRWPDLQTVGGVPFVVSDPLLAARDLAEAAVMGSGGEHVHLANAYSVSLANDYPALAAEAFCADGWNLPDGKPISVISRLRHHRPVLHQIRGPQFLLDVCEAGVDLGLQHFLLGGAPDVLEKLEAALTEQFPGIRIAGSFSPPFREASAEELAERDVEIVASGAQIIWVGLGTPKQDREAVRLARSTGLVAVAIGAAFDYAAGTLREAPVWVRRIGMEWAFRFLMEPRRLWRRYLIGNVHFLRVVMHPRTTPRA